MIANPREGVRYSIRTAEFGNETGTVVDATKFDPADPRLAGDTVDEVPGYKRQACTVRIDSGLRQGETVAVFLHRLYIYSVDLTAPQTPQSNPVRESA